MLERRGAVMVLAAVIIVVLIIGAVGTWFFFARPASGNSSFLGSSSLSIASSSSQGTACSNVAQYDESIPPAYQSMYMTLSQILDNFNQTLNENPSGKPWGDLCY